MQPYLAREEKVTVELYRMRDATAALAIYLAHAGVETPSAGLAERHTAGSHQLMLVKGSYFMAVNDDTGRSADAGPLGLESIITLGEGDVLRLGGTVTAAAGEYPDGTGGRFARIVADYPSAAEASTALAYLSAHLDSTIAVLRRGAAGFVCRDFAGRFGSVALAGARLSLEVNLSREPAARAGRTEHGEV